MAGTQPCNTVLLLGVVVVVSATALTAAMPSSEGTQEHQLAQAAVGPRETFGNGFPASFAENLPTKEFMGDFARRVRRQTGVTSTIESILSSPYRGSPASDHLQALIHRNSNNRPARQSPGQSRPPLRPPSPSSSSRFSPPPQESFTRPSPQSFRPQQETRPPGPSSSGRPFSSQAFQPSRDSPPRPEFSPPRPEFSPPRPEFSPSRSEFSPPRSEFSPHRPESSPRPSEFSPRPSEFSPRPSEFSPPRSEFFPSSSEFSPTRPEFSPRPSEFSPPRFTPSFTSSQPREGTSRPPFSRPFSGSFTEQQFASSDIDSFFDSARLPRQRRDVAAAAATRDDAGRPEHILVSPEGSSPNSVTALLNQGHRVPTQPRQHEQNQQGREQILGRTSSHPFAIPFVVPNAFELVGIRRRNDILGTAQGRQVGITDAIDTLLKSPYTGSLPDSLQSLFRSEDRRVERKIPPHSGPSQAFTVVGSDNPSLAVVRLFPRGLQSPPPPSRFAVTHPELPRPLRRTRRNVEQQGAADLKYNASRFKAKAVSLPAALHHVPEERSLPPPEKEFGEIIVHYEYGTDDPKDEDPGTLVFLHEDEVAALLSPFAERPSKPSSPRGGKPRPHTSPRGSKPRPHTSPREGKPKPYSVLGEGKPKPHPRPRLVRPLPVRPPLRQRPRHPNRIPAFKPGPSPPAHILPPVSSVRAPRHVVWENQRLPRITRQQDILLTRRILLQDDSLDPEAAREGSTGFIVGKPSDFPGFASIGGFGPMGDVDETNVADTFMQTINFPSVDFGPIDDRHPPFPQTPTFPQSPSFSRQVSELRVAAPLDPFPLPQHPSKGPPPPHNSNKKKSDSYNNVIFNNNDNDNFNKNDNNDNNYDNYNDNNDNYDNNNDNIHHKLIAQDSNPDNFTPSQRDPLPHSPSTLSHPHPTLSHPPPTLSHLPPTLSHPPPTVSHSHPTLSHSPPTLSHPPPTVSHSHPTLSLSPPTLSPPPPPPPPPSPPPHVVFSSNAIPAHRLSRPILRPPPLHRARPKRPDNGLLGDVVSPLRDFVTSAAPQLLRTNRQTQDVELKSNLKTRRRRAVPEEDQEETNPIPASLIPHKRVHRVQTESQAPHSRQPREDLDMKSSPAEVPHYFSSVSEFEFPRLQPRNRQRSALSRSAYVTGSRFSSHRSPTEFRREDGSEQPHSPDEDLLKPEGQRFYPSFNSRHPSHQISPSSRAPFFPSPPIPPRIPGPRGSRFLTRGLGFRESPNPSQRDQVGFRDLHHQGPPVRETSSRIKPDTAFSASRRPFHREQEHFGNDNSILGSGNFEVLRGGTFYDLDDTNGHQHGYDHLLHGDDFVLFPSARPPPSPPHTNYVDDFFSNFRDFSEFAVRRSDEGESSFVEDEYDPEYYGRGYGSELVHHLAPSNTAVEVKNATLTNTTTEANAKAGNENPIPTRSEKVGKDGANTTAGHAQPRTHRRPNNIQEVLEEVDPHPSDYTTSSAAVEEKDPMIAMF